MYRLLIVDDEPSLLKLYQRMLKPEGYEVFVCSSGNSAVPCALADKPDLIVLDVHLLDVDGFEVCRRLKAEPRTRHIPVILLTGAALAVESRVRGLESGAEDYLLKPISLPLLAARIRSLLKITAKPAK